MKTQYRFQIERVYEGAVPTEDLRLIIFEAYDEFFNYAVFDIIQSNGQRFEAFKRFCKRTTLKKADMDADEFSFLWRRAMRAAKAKNE